MTGLYAVIVAIGRAVAVGSKLVATYSTCIAASTIAAAKVAGGGIHRPDCVALGCRTAVSSDFAGYVVVDGHISGVGWRCWGRWRSVHRWLVPQHHWWVRGRAVSLSRWQVLLPPHPPEFRQLSQRWLGEACSLSAPEQAPNPIGGGSKWSRSLSSPKPVPGRGRSPLPQRTRRSRVLENAKNVQAPCRLRGYCDFL